MRAAIKDHRLMYVPNKLTTSRITLKEDFDGCSHRYELLNVQKISDDDTFHHILQQSIHRHYFHINANPVERQSDLLLPHANILEFHGQHRRIQFHNGIGYCQVLS